MIENASLRQFDADLEAFAKKVEVNLETVMKRAALDIFTRTVMKTPVDTGRLRSSWAIAVAPGDGAFAEQTEEPVPDLSEAEATAAAMAKVSNGLDYDAYNAIWVFTNVEYASIIENGAEGRAPVAMLATSIAEVRNEMDRIVRSVQ